MKYISIVLLLAAMLLQSPQKAGAQVLPDSFPDSLNQYNDLELVKVLADLSWQYREKESDNAIAYANKGIEIAENKGYNEQLSRLYNYLGVIYQHYKHEVQKAIPYYYKSLRVSLEVKDSIEIAYVYNNLGDAFYKIGNKPLAEQYALKSMQTFTKLNDTRGIAYSCINMGVINRENKQYDTAFYYFRKAISLREKMQDPGGIASAILEVAFTFSDMEQCDSSKHYFKQSLELHKHLDNKNYIAYSQIGMGKCFLRNHQYDSALLYYHEALEYMTERRNYTGIISSQLGIARVYSLTSKTTAAEQMYQQALENAQEYGATDDILRVYNDRADFFHQTKEYQQAYNNYKQYIHIFDSLFTAMQFQTLAEVENRFRISEELNSVNQSLKQKKQRQHYSVVIIGLLLLLIGALYLRQRVKDKLTAELQESIQLKNKIFNIISHDLISPFNVLLGYSQLMQEKLQQKEYDDATMFAGIIHDTADETCNMTKNLLNWAQAQRKNITLHKADFILEDLITEANSSYSHIAKNKDISITTDFQYNGVVHADPDLIRTTLHNLINNAIKFSKTSSKIQIGSIKKKGYVEIFVQDYGVGMSSEHLAMLFKESETISTPGTENEKGTGLGLLVCKEFVELNGGVISVTSTIGKGSRFTFTIPG